MLPAAVTMLGLNSPTTLYGLGRVQSEINYTDMSISGGEHRRGSALQKRRVAHIKENTILKR